MTEVRQLFATPFMIDDLHSAEGLRSLRRSVDRERARDAAGERLSNIGGWQSNKSMIEWGGEAAHALAFKAMTMADAMTGDSRSPDEIRHDWHPEMWANVGGKGSTNQYHFHPGAFWSAVAYVDDGFAGSDNPELGGELQLLDPRMPAVRMLAPDLRLKDDDGANQQNEIAIRPRTGTIVMFPGWLQHAVRPFEGAGTRISIAINLIAAFRKRA